MSLSSCLDELRSAWLPHVTDGGLNRLIELLEQGSPLLIHGAFTRALPMGCLASHIAWHHPRTASLNQDAGIAWLSRVAKLNPATSRVIAAWDNGGLDDWELRQSILQVLKHELNHRNDHPDSRQFRNCFTPNELRKAFATI